MKSAICLLLSVLCFGCATHLSRERAYSVLPYSQNDFSRWEKEYTILQIPAPAKLFQAEQGTAWEVVLHLQTGRTELFLATLMSYWDEEERKFVCLMDENHCGNFLVILPHSRQALAGARAMFWSHDHTVAFSLSGDTHGWCGDEDEYDWKRAELIAPYAQTILPGSDEDRVIKSWYQEAAKQPIVAEHNFALGAQYLRVIQKQDAKSWKTIRIIVTSGLGAGIVAIVATPLAGIIVGGLSATTQSVGEAITPPDLNFPEYSSGLVRRQEMMQMQVQAQAQIEKARPQGAAYEPPSR